MKPFWMPLGCAALVIFGAAGTCQSGSGNFSGGEEPDAGPGGNGPDLNSIGSVCTFDPATGANPTNTCPRGLECLIVTRRGEFTSGLALDIWEDQFSIYNSDGTDEGYCTLVGSVQDPPSCPAGTIAKVFTGGTMACIRTCTAESQCGRAEYTCDQRYLDLVDGAGPHASCVRRCGLDVPDCIRSGIIQNPNQPGTLIPVLAEEDLRGAATCNVETGVCALINQRTGGSGPGEPCVATDDCDDGAACLQGPLLEARLGASPETHGFCASPCLPGAGEEACTTNYACQDAGDLTLGFPNTLMVNTSTGAASEAGGFCFFTCEVDVAGNCGSVPETECGALDNTLLHTSWNGDSMCLPDILRR